MGGGFNERQNRASTTVVEVDEEGFDDFGRRIKKNAKSDRQAKEEAALKRLQEKYKLLMPGSSTEDVSATTSSNTISSTRDEFYEKKPQFKDDVKTKTTNDGKRGDSRERQHYKDRRDSRDRQRNHDQKNHRRDSRDRRGGGEDNGRRRRSKSRSRSRDRDRGNNFRR